MAKIKTLKTCSYCSKEVYKLANPTRGLCANCYCQERKTGSLERTKKRKSCTIDGCANLSVARGMCEVHYGRFMKHGFAVHNRFDRWGHKSSHPHKDRYHQIVRVGSSNYEHEWGDFWKFVEDIGEKPNDTTLRRIDPKKPWGPNNFYWRPMLVGVTSEARLSKSEYGRAHRMANPVPYRKCYLKKRYGVTLEWYEDAKLSQSNVCAICKNAETAINPKTGEPRDMAIDHCHTTGKIRGLLCSKCNTSLGGFRDSIDTLKSAIAYLEYHGGKD